MLINNGWIPEWFIYFAIFVGSFRIGEWIGMTIKWLWRHRNAD